MIDINALYNEMVLFVEKQKETVKEAIEALTFQNITVEAPKPNNSLSKTIGYGLSVAGSATLAGSLLTNSADPDSSNKLALMIGGGAILAGGLWMLSKNITSETENTVEVYDFNEVRRSLFKCIEDLVKQITESWDELIKKHQNKIQDAATFADYNVNNKILDLSIQNSFIKIDNKSILSDLGDLERQGEIQGFLDYKSRIVAFISDAIDSALQEQSKIYKAIEETIANANDQKIG